MRVLVIDEAAKAGAARLRQFALDHPENLSSLIRRLNKPEEAPGLDPNFVLNLFDGYRVVFTYEQAMQEPVGWCFHISLSVDQRSNKRSYPHPVAVNQILELFGLPEVSQADGMKQPQDGVLEFWFRHKVC